MNPLFLYQALCKKKLFVICRELHKFLSNFNFYFYFFSDRRTLKFLEVKCNPINKKVSPKETHQQYGNKTYPRTEYRISVPK